MSIQMTLSLAKTKLYRQCQDVQRFIFRPNNYQSSDLECVAARLRKINGQTCGQTKCQVFFVTTTDVSKQRLKSQYVEKQLISPTSTFLHKDLVENEAKLSTKFDFRYSGKIAKRITIMVGTTNKLFCGLSTETVHMTSQSLKSIMLCPSIGTSFVSLFQNSKNHYVNIKMYCSLTQCDRNSC